MEIFIWKALGMVREKMSKLSVAPRKERGNRRTNSRDRRRSVCDGLSVSLSTREDKRKIPDRRRLTTDGQQLIFPRGRGTLFDEGSV